MTGQWKDRIIRGGAIAVMTVAALGGMAGLTGVMAGYPGALRAGGIILAAAACIGRRCVPRNCEHPQPAADGRTAMPPPGPALSPETLRDTIPAVRRSLQGDGVRAVHFPVRIRTAAVRRAVPVKCWTSSGVRRRPRTLLSR